MRLCWLLCLGICLSASAQKLPTIEEKTKNFKKYEGFLDFYWDDNTPSRREGKTESHATESGDKH